MIEAIISDNTENNKIKINNISIASDVTSHGIKIIPNIPTIIDIVDITIINISMHFEVRELKQSNKFINLNAI